jgi:hypothetical protein
MISVLCLVAACGSDKAGADNSGNSIDIPAGTGSVEGAINGNGKAQVVGAQDTLSETDQLMLTEAETACKNGNPNAFFDTFIRSAAVRRKYSAATFDYVLRSTSGGDILSREKIKSTATDLAGSGYDGFPIKMVDYYRKPVTALKHGDDEYVAIELNHSSDSRFVVEWARIYYQGPGEGGDDLGTPFDLDGQPYDNAGFKDGQLLFYPTSTCWQLVTDTRFQRL